MWLSSFVYQSVYFQSPPSYNMAMSTTVNFRGVLALLSEKAENLLTTGLGVTGVAMASDALYYAVMRAVQRRAMCETMFSQRILWNKPPSLSEEREAMMRYLMKKFTQLSTYSLLCVNKGCGNTTVLRKLATSCRGVMYISLLNAATLDDVVNILRTELNIKESAKMGTITLMLHKFLKLSEVIEEAADHAWEEVTSIYEGVAMDVKQSLRQEGREDQQNYSYSHSCQEDAAILILDHVDGLENDVAAAIQGWAATCQQKALMHIVIVTTTPFRFFGTNQSTSQEVIVLAGASIKEGISYARNRLRSLEGDFIIKLVSRTGPKLGDINAACRFLDEDVNFITSEVICPHYAEGNEKPMVCIPGDPIIALQDGKVHDEGLVFRRLDAHLLFRFQADFRSWHVYGHQPMGDEELDERRFYIFLLVLRLEKRIDEDIAEGRTPADCPFSAFKVYIDFDCIFKFVPMRVFASLVSQRIALPLRTQFNEVGFKSPSDFTCFKWAMGELYTQKRSKFLSELPRLLPEAEKHVLERKDVKWLLEGSFNNEQK